MIQDNTGLAAMAEALSRSTDYRVLRRLIPRTTFTPSVGDTRSRATACGGSDYLWDTKTILWQIRSFPTVFPN
jgi:hypothetical protein